MPASHPRHYYTRKQIFYADTSTADLREGLNNSSIPLRWFKYFKIHRRQ